uniref:Uncharacterized protein n=1 Tax=Oryza glumipatula TaxID=40148 RepID=A0A0D9ZZM6_9ORYZ
MSVEEEPMAWLAHKERSSRPRGANGQEERRRLWAPTSFPQTPAAEEKPTVVAAQTAPAAPLPELDRRGEPADSGKGSAPLALGQRHRTEVESRRRATDPPTKITYFHRRWDSGG